MVTINWCLKQNLGIKIVEPNQNMASSYLKMAEESVNVLNKMEQSRIWTATTSYYIFYYSLYSLMLRIGVKCEIHSCSIEFLKQMLTKFYDSTDILMFETAFSARIDLQYYSDRPVDEQNIIEVKKYCIEFYIKTKDIHSTITESQIKDIRSKLLNVKGK